jgi:hypothetical protein
MAKIVLDRQEVRLFRKSGKVGKEIRKSLYESAMQIAGDLGGWGIDLVDEDGNDLSTEEYEYQYGRPKPEPKVVIKDERTLPTEIIKR